MPDEPRARRPPRHARLVEEGEPILYRSPDASGTIVYAGMNRFNDRLVPVSETSGFRAPGLKPLRVGPMQGRPSRPQGCPRRHAGSTIDQHARRRGWLVIPVAPPPPIEQPSAQVQAAMDVATTYLERRGLGPRSRPTLGHVTHAPYGYTTATAAVSLETGVVELRPRAFEGARALYRARWSGEPLSKGDASLVLHEVLHLRNPGASEGLVEAVAQDHTARFVRRWTGRTYNFGSGGSAYSVLTAQVRHESATACGTAWDAPCAREFRAHKLRGEQ